MKRLLLLFVLALSSIMVFGQVTKEVDNGVYVTFPNNPEYKVTSNTPTYTSKTNNAIFMVVVQRVIPEYNKYLESKKGWTYAEVKTVENSFLNGAVKGVLEYTGNEGSVRQIKKGSFNAREISYSAINPATGERGSRYTTLVLVGDKILSFQVLYLTEGSEANKEKDLFFSSIGTNGKVKKKVAVNNGIPYPDQMTSADIEAFERGNLEIEQTKLEVAEENLRNPKPKDVYGGTSGVSDMHSVGVSIETTPYRGVAGEVYFEDRKKEQKPKVAEVSKIEDYHYIIGGVLLVAVISVLVFKDII